MSPSPHNRDRPNHGASGRHLGQDELILFHYGEAEDRALIESHLQSCADCHRSYQGLCSVLAAVGEMQVPERSEDYGRQVWWRVQGRLFRQARKPASIVILRRWAAVTAIAASIVFAFVLGRVSREPDVWTAQGMPGPVRERILLVAVGEHLERSQMVLVELTNAESNGGVDLTSERAWAQELVPANRLFRQAAALAGENGLAAVLEDLERTLVEIATSPDALSVADFEEMRRRIEAQGILFKVRVIGSRVRQKENAARVAARVAS